MRQLCASSILLCSVVVSTTSLPAMAQTATGTGVATSKSSSAAQAVAISGQGGNGGSSNSSLVVNNPANPAVSTVNQNLNTSGTSTIKNVPTVFSPGLAAAGLETCLGSVSAGVGVIGTGVSFGTTIPDAGCAARLDARTLWSMGLKKAAVARLCLNTDIYHAMPDVCAIYLPNPQSAGYAVASIEPEYVGGPVEVIVQKTGEHRMCDDYNTTRHRCRVWAH